MDVLCFDIGSGGVKGARFDDKLVASAVSEVPWHLHRDSEGRATLPSETLLSAIQTLTGRLNAMQSPVAAVSAGCFMHSFLVLSSCCDPLTPIYTWLDITAGRGVASIRSHFGEEFHRLTGCRYYPMYPVFKLAERAAGRGNRVASPKALLAQELTGVFVDDFGMASSTGLLNLYSGRWHPELLKAVGIEEVDLPVLGNPDAIVGHITPEAAGKFGVPKGTPLVNGSGDGFLANVGSGCTDASRIAVTLGTSAVARQMISAPAVERDAGTFCYRATTDAFLLGCAGNNGGNVLDWARNAFGALDLVSKADTPIFLPWLNGERSIEWDPNLRASWSGLTSQHAAQDLARSVAEGVLFNLAQYVEVVQQQSGAAVREVLLSGNGFREPGLAAMLASLVPGNVLLPPESGLATLRGAAVYAWRALGHDVSQSIEGLVSRAERIAAVPDEALHRRFKTFKELRRLTHGA